ncbi:hypothetical protein Pint_09821 [Pistacia integerrima]|uniref:Uncharacterized protein n=1 Tax=Pistacia integerrima TaxID=434235 RepID=A0ACC0XFK2_9ROSI|nr:hypothetical protein Pint_09821 [Pistacia integerrima]
MNKKSLAILLRARMRPNNSTKLALSPLPNEVNLMQSSGSRAAQHALENENKPQKEFEHVRESMRLAISMNKTEVLDTVLSDFSEGYYSLSYENRRTLLLVLAKEFDLNRTQVRELIKQYLGVDFCAYCEEAQLVGAEEAGGYPAAFYRIERNLRHALKPMYESLFERLNMHPGGLKFLSRNKFHELVILQQFGEENIASLRALDSYLKEILSTWLSPAALELHQIMTQLLCWRKLWLMRHASIPCLGCPSNQQPYRFKEKAGGWSPVFWVFTSSNTCFPIRIAYIDAKFYRCNVELVSIFTAEILREPLIFIEVALLKNVSQTIQCALILSRAIPELIVTEVIVYAVHMSNISFSVVICPKGRPGLAGINLGKFLIKRVITLVNRGMPQISTYAMLSLVPGYIQWLISKLASQSKLAEVEDISQSSDEFIDVGSLNLVPSTREKERKGSRLCCKFSLAKWSVMSYKLTL